MQRVILPKITREQKKARERPSNYFDGIANLFPTVIKDIVTSVQTEPHANTWTDLYQKVLWKK